MIDEKSNPFNLLAKSLSGYNIDDGFKRIIEEKINDHLKCAEDTINNAIKKATIMTVDNIEDTFPFVINPPNEVTYLEPTNNDHFPGDFCRNHYNSADEKLQILLDDFFSKADPSLETSIISLKGHIRRILNLLADNCADEENLSSTLERIIKERDHYKGVVERIASSML